VQVHCDEGIANYIGPEPCAGAREDVGEASVGERIGQPLSLENILYLGADAVDKAESNTFEARDRERPNDPAWSKTLACAYALCTGAGRSRF
jgi:hypothetical protein